MSKAWEQRMVAVVADCPARAVPSGTSITLPKNAFVTITQARGGNFTVSYQGNLARVDGVDAAALGLEPAPLEFDDLPADASLEDKIWHVLRTIYDPEIPVNIVDLGLVYAVTLDSEQQVTVTMTLTSPTCGMGQVLTQDVKYRVGRIPAVTAVEVALVFDPPWSRDMITEEAQLELGLF